MDELGKFIIGVIGFLAVAYVAVILVVAAVAAVFWLAAGVVISVTLVALPTVALTLLAIRLRSVDLRQAWYRLRGAEAAWLLPLALLAFPAYFMAIKLDFNDQWPVFVMDDMAGIVMLAWVNLAALGVVGLLLVYDVLVPYVKYRLALREAPDLAGRHLRPDHSIDLAAIAEDAPSLRVFGKPRPEITRAFKTRLNQATRKLRIPLPATSVEPTYTSRETRDIREAAEVVSSYAEYTHSAGERELERQTQAKLDELRRSGTDLLHDDT